MRYLKKFSTESDYQTFKEGVEYLEPNVSSITDNNKIYYNSISLYKFIDLGLPSGTKWADRNVGATTPESVGLYFQWGDIQGYKDTTTKSFTISDYKFYGGSFLPNGGSFNLNIMTKYNNSYAELESYDNKSKLDLIDDAAYNIDKKMIIPSQDNFIELMNNSIMETKTVNNIDGILFTSKINGNNIFIPFAGVLVNDSLQAASNAVLWANECSYDTAYMIQLPTSNINKLTMTSREFGLQIRPIYNDSL